MKRWRGEKVERLKGEKVLGYKGRLKGEKGKGSDEGTNESSDQSW